MICCAPRRGSPCPGRKYRPLRPGTETRNPAAESRRPRPPECPRGRALRNSSITSGTSVLWPAASEDTPSTWTSFSTAMRAASRGVWNSGPTSTSKPISANAVAITLAPRSCPSWPIFAIRMRGRRPSSRANSSAICLGLLEFRIVLRSPTNTRRRSCGSPPDTGPTPSPARTRSRPAWRARAPHRPHSSSRLPFAGSGAPASARPATRSTAC